MVVDEGQAPNARRRAVLSGLRAVVDDDAGVGSNGDGSTALTRELLRLCAATTAWFGASGAAVNLMAGDRRDWVVADSDQRGRRMAELPFAVGEGPAFDAFESRRPVLVADLAEEGRSWPGYAATALELGVHAVSSVPLHVGSIQLGVLECYDLRPRLLEAEETAMLSEFAAVATEVLLGAPEILDGRLVHTGSGAMDQREQVYQAQGMVMVDLGIDLDEALVRMRAHAFGRGVPLTIIARDVIAGLTLPGDVE